MDAFIQAINNLTGNPSITTLLVSLVPMIELKGSILFARASGIDFIMSYLLSFLGSTAVFFPIFFLLIPVLNLLKKVRWFNSFALAVENYFATKAQGVGNKKKGNLSENALKTLGVFIFVAIPLPMTGVWTGTAIAVFLGLKFRHALPAVALGNIIAGLIISVLAELFRAYIDYILYGLFALVIVVIIITVVKIILSRPKKDKGEN